MKRQVKEMRKNSRHAMPLLRDKDHKVKARHMAL